MGRAIVCFLAAVSVLLGCGDDESKIPIKPQEPVVAPRAEIPARSYRADELIGKYWAAFYAKEADKDQKKLLDVARQWYLELKPAGRFSFNFTELIEGSYTVAGDVLKLNVERMGTLTIQELESMVRRMPSDAKDKPNIDEMRTFEFRVLDAGKNLVMMKDGAVEPGGLTFERRN